MPQRWDRGGRSGRQGIRVRLRRKITMCSRSSSRSSLISAGSTSISTVALGERRHLAGIYGRGAEGVPGRYNARWREYIGANPNASAKDVYQFGGRLMDEYGLSGLPIKRYGSK